MSKTAILLWVLLALVIIAGIVVLVIFLVQKHTNNLGSSIGRNVMIEGDKYLQSPNGEFRFKIIKGAGTLYHVDSGVVVWHSCDTDMHSGKSMKGGHIYLQNDGNLMNRVEGGLMCDLVYHFMPPTTPPTKLVLTDDGELHLLNDNNDIMWVNGKVTDKWVRKKTSNTTMFA